MKKQNKATQCSTDKYEVSVLVFIGGMYGFFRLVTDAITLVMNYFKVN